MNKYVTFLGIVAVSHVVRCVSEYAYYTQCAGFWNSIFTWNSPTCRGLRWAADSVMTNVVSIVGVHATKLLEF
jgi:hypothetical protein